MAVPVSGRRHLVLLFEKFNKVRRVGECTGIADFRNRLRSRNQQQTRMHQALADVPFVGRHHEMAPEFLFERGERTVGEFRKLLDRNVLEDVVVDDLFEILLGRVDVAQQLDRKSVV